LRAAIQQAAGRGAQGGTDITNKIATNPNLQAKIRAILPPDEAEHLINAANQTRVAGRGMSSIAPQEKTAAAESAAASAHAVRAATLGLHGGSSSFVAHNVEWLWSKLRIPPGAARKVAELSTDPAQTPAVMNYLKAHGGTAAMRREYLGMLRNQAAGVQAAAQASGMAAATATNNQNPQPEPLQ
jgi:hypothetical protein